jgi:hypothetical protein
MNTNIDTNDDTITSLRLTPIYPSITLVGSLPTVNGVSYYSWTEALAGESRWRHLHHDRHLRSGRGVGRARKDGRLMAKNPHAVALGRKGGSATSKAKTDAARENGKLGGRPPKQKPAK